MMMDDETLQMYVEEATEHLGDIENDLLTIEQAGADIDEELVNKVFRAAHSIKGGAGFLGLNRIKDLGHKIENVLDMMRNRELVPDPEVVNIVLLAFDKLRDMISNVAESNDEYIDDHIAALTAATSGSLEPAQKETVARTVQIKDKRGRVVFDTPEFDLIQNRKGGKTLYLLEFDLIHDVQRKKKTVFDLLKSMDMAGVILDRSHCHGHRNAEHGWFRACETHSCRQAVRPHPSCGPHVTGGRRGRGSREGSWNRRLPGQAGQGTPPAIHL